MSALTGQQPRKPDVAELFASWRRAPETPVACPDCSGTLTVTDRSARPYAEWYNFKCTACGFDQTMHIPMAGPGL
jgi:hypothetical protein